MADDRSASRDCADGGFTLVEALTAMTVLAISAAALMGVAETQGGRVGGLEERAAARWAAETVLAEIRAGARPPEDGTAEMEMFGATVSVRVAVTPTGDPAILSVSAQARAETPRAPGARVEGFVLAGGAGP
jgi:type II secretion system protein I